MSDFRKSLERYLQDSEFEKEYEATEAEYQLSRAQIVTGIEVNLTQRELVEERQPHINMIKNYV